MQEQIDEINKKLDKILAIYEKENWQDRMVLYRSLQLKDKNQSTVLDSGLDGIKLGASGGKIGLYGGTPVARGSTISDPSGGATIDPQARTAITAILTVLRNLNVIAP